MLEVMHDLWQEGDRLAAFACAEKIAPYLHARLAAVEQKVETQVRQTVINGAPLSIEEFDLKYGVERDEQPPPQDAADMSFSCERDSVKAPAAMRCIQSQG